MAIADNQQYSVFRTIGDPLNVSEDSEVTVVPSPSLEVRAGEIARFLFVFEVANEVGSLQAPYESRLVHPFQSTDDAR